MPTNPILSVLLDPRGQRLHAIFVRQHGGHVYQNPTMASRRRLNTALQCRPTVETRMGISYMVRANNVAQPAEPH